mgnify:FL=1
METGETANAKRPHVRYLDGLRGVAILAVLLIHFEQLIHGLSQPARDLAFYGVRGVQLFFIVSGLTLTMNYVGRPFHLVNFAARRFFRIAPMFYAGILLYLLLNWLTEMPLPTDSATPLDVAATILFLHGWLPSAINTVVPGGWSIAAEAMFYVAFPALLWAARTRRRMVAVTVASYGIAATTYFTLQRLLHGTAGGREFAQLFWLVHAPAFVGGCWLATVRDTAWTRPVARFVLPASIVGLLIDSQLRGHSNLLVAIALLTALVWSAGAVRPRILEGKALPLIGQISFSLYILHFTVIGALRPVAPKIEAAVGPNAALLIVYITTLLTAGAFSWAAWQWIEQPIIRATRRVGLHGIASQTTNRSSAALPPSTP